MNTSSENSLNELLRKYLNRITIQLMFGVPRPERQAIREEVTQHLAAMIEDEAAQGKLAEEATRAALRRFGNPSKVGKDLRKRWMKKHPQPRAKNKVWNWRRWGLSFLLQMLWVVPCWVWFPDIINADGQARYSLFLATLHGGMNSLLMMASLSLWLKFAGVRVYDLASPHFLTDMGDTQEEQAKAFAEEMGRTVTPEGMEKSRRWQRKVPQILWAISIAFWGSVAVALYFVVKSQSMAYADQGQWCYQVGRFAAIGLFGSIITSRLFEGGQGRKKASN